MPVTGNMSYYYKRKVADLALGQQSYTPVTGIFVGLWLSALDFSASGAQNGEVTGAGYSRFSAVNNLNNWSTALTASGTAYKWNLTDFTFPTALSTWGNVQYFGVVDAATQGNMLYWGELNTAKAIVSADVFRFPSGQLVITHT